MAISGFPIYLSTMLLERNRWNGKGPSLLVSDWMEPIAEAGFAGVEIWMPHLLFASRSEWELIKEKSRESDLLLAHISAAVPADGSDKSQRMREAILEACDYFRPDGLKFSLGGEARSKGAAAEAAALEFLKSWIGDVQRDVGLLHDPGLDSAPSNLAKAKKTLGGGRSKGVLHPFGMTPADVEAAMALSGDFLSAMGVQARREDQWCLLSEKSEDSLRTIDTLRKRGFKGTWSLELTKGAGGAGESIDKLFDNAEKDLNFLLEALAGAHREKS